MTTVPLADRDKRHFAQYKLARHRVRRSEMPIELVSFLQKLHCKLQTMARGASCDS